MLTKTIEEVTETLIDYRGKTPPKTNCGTKLITAKIIKDGFVQNNNLEYISEETYETWMRRGMPKQWDILITTEAPLGEVAQLRTTEKIALAQRVILLRGDPQIIDQQYYFQALKSSFVQAGLQTRATGTTVAGIKQSELRQVEIPYYPLPTQRKIAAILSVYDDLIENNTRRIEILEEMAQAIYREWFVEFRFPGHEGVPMVESEVGLIPQGWEVGKLGDAIENIKAKVKPGKHLESLSYVPIDCIPRRSIGLVEHKPSSEAKSSLIAFKRNDILFGAMRSYFHKVIFAPFDGITRQTCFVLRSKTPDNYPFDLFTMFQDSTVEYSSNYSTGSTIPYATWDGALAIMPIVRPPDLLIKRFSDIVAPILDSIRVLTIKNANLRQTRDLLLPKLISGEIDVSELDIDIDGNMEVSNG